MTTLAERWPAYEDCRAAARAVRSAQYGREAYGTVRPRGVTGVIRSRGPLAVLLYVASREGRLIWQGVDEFALLEPPVTDPAQARGTVSLRLLRMVDRRWELLVYAGPPVLGLIAAVACLPFRPLWTVAVLLALAAASYVAVLMLSVVVAALGWLYRTFGRLHARPGADAVEALPPYQWTLRLCHCADPAAADDLMRRISSGLDRLIETRVTASATAHGARSRGVDVVELMVWLVRGVTTQPMRDQLTLSDRVHWPYGSDSGVAVTAPPERSKDANQRWKSTASFLLWYLGGSAVVIAVCAWIVADRERARCGDSCAGRPAGYWDALRWLLGQGDHLVPAADGTWVMAPLVRVVLWLTIPVAAVATWQVRRSAKLDREQFQKLWEELTRRPRVVIVVVTEVEWRTVLDVAREFVGDRSGWDDHRAEVSARRLGDIGGCDVMVARSGPGPTSPRGIMLTTDALIRALNPEYVVLAGICFGLKDDEVRPGDVVIASQVRDLDHRKVIDVQGVVVEQSRGDRVGPSLPLFNRFAGAEPRPHGVTVHVGPMVGSGTLFNSLTRRGEVRRDHPDALAGDMESHLFASVAVRHGTQWCVVRGVSDRGMHKGDALQPVAAEKAARFLFEVIRSGGVAAARPR